MNNEPNLSSGSGGWEGARSRLQSGARALLPVQCPRARAHSHSLSQVALWRNAFADWQQRRGQRYRGGSRRHGRIVMVPTWRDGSGKTRWCLCVCLCVCVSYSTSRGVSMLSVSTEEKRRWTERKRMQ